jgi:hypothetical protein
MTERIVAPRLADIIEAIERIRRVLDGVTLEAFEQNWEKRWLVERGIEIISEASRHLTDDIKERPTRNSVAKSSRDRQCSSSCLRSRRARCALEACTRRSGGNRKSLP